MPKATTKYNATLALIFALLLFACNSDDLKNVKISKVKISKNVVERTFGVDLTYSDSAIVKAKGMAPILDKVTPANGQVYSEMPKGVKIEFYNRDLLKTGTITSNYAIRNEFAKQTIFRKNVVIVSDKINFNTEELIWDENKKKFFSPYGKITRPDGSFSTGTKFTANQDFSDYNIENASGETYIKSNLTQ